MFPHEHRDRWMTVVLLLPPMTLIAAEAALLFHLDVTFIDSARRYLPASIAPLAPDLPVLGWALLTLGCSVVIWLDGIRLRGTGGWRLLVELMIGTPVLALALALLSFLLAVPGLFFVALFRTK